MIQEARQYRTGLAVIGSGLAGFAASVFALQRGIRTAQVGNTGAIAYTTGYLDLLGWHGDRLLDNPWSGLATLRQEEPDHPLSRISDQDIREAFFGFTQALSEMGVDYTPPGDRNLLGLTPAGTRKPTLCMPRTMVAGIAAAAAGDRTLILDIAGLDGFSARELVANAGASWPNLRSRRIIFPGVDAGVRVFPEVMARALEAPAHRQQLAGIIRSVAGDAKYIGLPAILGIHRPDRVHRDLERLTGFTLFEIPTMPPAVPGIRLREMFEQAFPARGLTLVPQQKVKSLELGKTTARLHLNDSYGKVEIEAETVILATGRFLSGGLAADRHRVRETLLGIPVSQPESRDHWYREDYFDLRGHPINRCGIRVDEAFRPISESGRPISERLFAAGILLGGQDWIRQRCGAGVAIASAYRAVSFAAGCL